MSSLEISSLIIGMILGHDEMNKRNLRCWNSMTMKFPFNPNHVPHSKIPSTNPVALISHFYTIFHQGVVELYESQLDFAMFAMMCSPTLLFFFLNSLTHLTVTSTSQIDRNKVGHDAVMHVIANIAKSSCDNV